ncbi:unnamed protein product [Schistocephalus solidus]|uniref:GCM domain-containing protein n=1 Tax=Schistocephalus solidus TaxID=70667 RepID=A0A183TPF2_SCHSO|nr:unnamed protein product [Schistocephalus solidus]
MEICDANRLNVLSFYGTELPTRLNEAAFRRTPLSQVASCPPANCNYYTSDYRGTIFNPFDRGDFQTASQHTYPYSYCPIDISSAALTMERASRLAIQSYQQQPDYDYQQHSQPQPQQMQLCARSTRTQLPLSFALLTNDAEKMFSKTGTNVDLPLRPIVANSTSPEVHWDINDQALPKVQDFDTFELWPDGHCRMVYAKTSSDSVRRHASGWAMRNTNNHNSQILKKSCLGVLLCTTSTCGIALRPAICDKARRSQEGKCLHTTLNYGSPFSHH